MDTEQARELLIEAGRRLWLRGLVAASDGNLSCRLPDGRFLITRSGVSKGYLSAGDLLLVDGSGRVVAGTGRPSIETGLHLAVYRARPEAQALVHAHPPLATAYALTGQDLNREAPDEVRLQLGRVALADYGEAGSAELAANAAAAAATGANAVLLRRHGALTLGNGPEQALFRMEALEQAAKMMLAARLLRLTPPEA
ncbi:MAG: class II aldolase/adducin family protein [Firmicutes bacterium]|nr:class II aldolase/adducin family protein [Bacillota bacterium]